MPGSASSTCSTSLCHLYQLKLLILSSGDAAVHHLSNPSTQKRCPYPLPGYLYKFSHPSLKICSPTVRTLLPVIGTMTATIRRRTMLPVIGMMQHVIGVILPGVGLMLPIMATMPLVVGWATPPEVGMMPLSSIWSCVMGWRQLCCRRSPPAGSKFGGRWRHTQPEGPLHKCCQMILPGFVHRWCRQPPQCAGTLNPDHTIVNGNPMYPPISSTNLFELDRNAWILLSNKPHCYELIDA